MPTFAIQRTIRLQIPDDARTRYIGHAQTGPNSSMFYVN